MERPIGGECWGRGQETRLVSKSRVVGKDTWGMVRDHFC